MYIRVIFLIFTTAVLGFSQRFPSFQKLKFGNNLSTEIFVGSAPAVTKVLPDADLNIHYNWIEPVFDDPHWLLQESFLKYGISVTQSPWYSRFGTQLGFKLTEFFEFGIGYSSLVYWQSSVELAPSEDKIQKWNTETVREQMYQSQEFDNLQTVHSMGKFILDYKNWLFITELHHVLIDINTKKTGYSYDYYYGIPVYERDQIVTLKMDFKLKLWESNWDLFLGNRYVNKGFTRGLWERYKDEGMYKSSFRLGSIYHFVKRDFNKRIILGVDLVSKNSDYIDTAGETVQEDVTDSDRFYLFLAYQSDFSFFE